MATCKTCGAVFEEGTPSRGTLHCPACVKDKKNLFFSYSALRYDLWQCVNHNKPAAIKIYNEMCDEEGADWAHKALGEKLTAAIIAIL